MHGPKPQIAAVIAVREMPPLALLMQVINLLQWAKTDRGWNLIRYRLIQITQVILCSILLRRLSQCRTQAQVPSPRLEFEKTLLKMGKLIAAPWLSLKNGFLPTSFPLSIPHSCSWTWLRALGQTVTSTKVCQAIPNRPLISFITHQSLPIIDLLAV